MSACRLHGLLAAWGLLGLCCVEPPPPAIPNLSGTWIIEERRQCGDVRPDTYPIVVSHVGSDVRFFDPALNATVSGTLSGDTIDLHGTYFDEDVVGTVEIISAEITVAPEGDFAAGTTTMKFTSALDPSVTCEGQSTIAATKQQES